MSCQNRKTSSDLKDGAVRVSRNIVKKEIVTVKCPSQETEVTSTPTRPVDNVVIATLSTGFVGVEVTSVSWLEQLTVGV